MSSCLHSTQTTAKRGTIGTPPGRGTTPTARQQAGLEYSRPQHFIVIPLTRASPETIGYAVQADDVIYDMGISGMGGTAGGGYGGATGGRGGYGGDYGTTNQRGGTTRGGIIRGTDYGGTTSSRGTTGRTTGGYW